MNFLYLSPHFPRNYHPFPIQLARRGVRVLGLADVPYDELPPDLRASLTEYYKVADLHNFAELVSACEHFIARHGRIDRIESNNEYWLEAQARLRDRFDIPGIRSDRIVDIKRKSRMKEIFARAGVEVAPGAVVRGGDEARRVARQLGYPVVAKPDIGVGAAATSRLGDDGEIEAFFAGQPAVDYMIERFVDGRIETFDGLADRDGNLLYWGSLRYSQGIMETVNEDLHIYYYTVREVPADLEEVGRRVARAFDCRESFFHFEFFRAAADDHIVALEVNMRPPGGLTTDMFNYACDIDVYGAWADVVAHGTSRLDFSRRYYCAYVGRKRTIRYHHDHDSILQRCGSAIAHHDSIDGVFRAALGDYGYLVRSPDLDDLHSAIAFIQKAA